MQRIFYHLRIFFLTGILSVSPTDSNAQDLIDFSFEKTGPNHSVLILPTWHPVLKELKKKQTPSSDLVFGFKGDSLETGDLVGVFYQDVSGNLKCAGSLTWTANDFNMLPVWGQYPPGTDNGMEIGEKMIWFAQKKDDFLYEIDVTYQKPLMAIYLKDGASAVLGMELRRSEMHKPLRPLTK
tara:strand:+ start:502 stop:1047 length:546 start_codon:yes stop_codon:yes gene_type:complete